MTKEKTLESWLSSYSFQVPEDQVAQAPKQQRDQSKLLERTQDGMIRYHTFSHLVDLIPKDSLIIVNETKVFSCRLLTKTKTGGKIEVFLLENPEAKKSSTLKALVRPFKKAQEGLTLEFDKQVLGTIIKKEKEASTATVTLQFNLNYENLSLWINEKGHVPLPPYIKRSDRSQHTSDLTQYQTVYAESVGSVAAPTAGLHFTKDLLAKLKEKNIQTAAVTLHVGLGTFLPIKEEVITNHTMHEEVYQVSKETLLKINKAKNEKRKIIIVGTTSLRCLESFFLKAKKENKNPEVLSNVWHKTTLFIHPTKEETRYKPQVGDALITNFHQPHSTLFILICALVGREEALMLYHEAIKQGYRFYSYGDSSLLWL